MKISLNTAINSMTPFQGWLWSVSFGDSSFNVLDAGGGVGKEFPALTVQEDLFKVTYDSITVANNFTVEVPQNVDYLGYLNISFWDKMSEGDAVILEQAFRKWVGEIHSGNKFKPLATSTKLIYVKKYDKWGSGKVKESQYEVLPPPELTFTPSGSVDVYTNSVRLPIVKTIKIHE